MAGVPFAPRIQRRGFTLLELLVVIVIIGLLASYVGPKYFAQLGKSEVATARAQIDALSKAVDTFRLDVGRVTQQFGGLGGSIQQARFGNGLELPVSQRRLCR